MNCTQCEERMSDYLENAISVADCIQMDVHLQSCAACSELISGVKGVVAWAEAFPVHDAPAWLASRVVANTPRVARERWIETLGYAWRWLIEPRTAMDLFTSTLVLGGLGSLAGISPN